MSFIFTQILESNPFMSSSFKNLVSRAISILFIIVTFLKTLYLFSLWTVLVAQSHLTLCSVYTFSNQGICPSPDHLSYHSLNFLHMIHSFVEVQDPETYLWFGYIIIIRIKYSFFSFWNSSWRWYSFAMVGMCGKGEVSLVEDTTALQDTVNNGLQI